MKTQSQPPQVRYVVNVGGKKISAFRCTTVADLENQSEVPPWVLALISLPPVHGSKLLISSYTRFVLERLFAEVGSAAFLDCLRSVISDIEHGFRANNPVGVFISRCRSLADVDGFISVEGRC